MALAAPAWGAPLQLKLDDELDGPARTGSAAAGGRTRSVVLRANDLRSRPDLDTVAEGDVDFRHAGTMISADRLSYDNADDQVSARGKVLITHDGNTYRGPELRLSVQRFEGYFLSPEFEFARTGAHGRADRVDFLDASRSMAHNASYSSCLASDAAAEPDWILRAERVKLDLETNEGVAEGAQLRFLGVPILAVPVLSFPLSDARRSGWLPPNLNLDSKSGIELGLPYYWNIAPNRDATVTPTVYARRGLALDAEFRYLERQDQGRVELAALPNDRVAGRSRWALQFEHSGRALADLSYQAKVLRVGDDLHWKDFPRQVNGLTPRLLALDFGAQQGLHPGGILAGLKGEIYSRVQDWQVLQTEDTPTAIAAPYQRLPQLGLRLAGTAGPGLRVSLQSEVNRFTLPANSQAALGADGISTVLRPDGWRWHALASVGRPWEAPGWWVRPQFTLNTAVYRTDQAMADGRRQASRSIPTFSVDAGMVFERDSHWFGRQQRQTLEPRLLYVNTPYRDQSSLPKFDTAGRDFNLDSVFAENAFTGVDRVSDAHQITAGVSTRLLDETTGAETLRLGLAQRFLLRDQRVTAGVVNAQGFEPEGDTFTQRFSDLLLEGSSSLVPHWRLDAAVQFSADTSRAVRSILGARYSPGPFRTVSTTYRLARGLSEQLELAWQWPVYRGAAADRTALANAGSGRCQGTLYAVGRINYSLKDSRVTDSIAGLEYDAGCWIARVVGERLSTGRSEATTRLLLQLELVGLSRLGSNPLRVLKDNIPGYQLLREERDNPLSAPQND
ncbi:organic solvent tolerance protein OstA [Burkholderiales bacterium JOSHI_001]|nr:organic solvent tolerance protein OstA [Burkholderiales bacterium JOSHI_001]